MKNRLLSYLTCIIFSLLHTAIIAAELEVQLTGNQTTLTNVVIYLDPSTNITLPVTNKTVVIGQQSKSFNPYISVMQLGSDVTFTNMDDITHHIYSPIGKNKFDFKIRAGEQQTKHDFVESGEVAMGCNIHDWMSGYLLILDTPYFEKTDKNGHSHFKNIKAGKYQLTIWHPQLNTPDHKIIQDITLKQSQQLSFDVTDLFTKIPEQKSNDDFDFLENY
jgi:plastocyanin